MIRSMVIVLAVGLAGLATSLEGQTASEAGGKVAYSLSTRGDDVLENGLVRLVFSRHTGQFVAQSSEGEVMRLSETGRHLRKTVIKFSRGMRRKSKQITKFHGSHRTG